MQTVVTDGKAYRGIQSVEPQLYLTFYSFLGIDSLLLDSPIIFL